MSSIVSLGEITTLYDSLHKTPKSYMPEGYPMIRVTDVARGFVNTEGVRYVDVKTYEEFSKKHKPTFGDIIYARVGNTFGKSCFVNVDLPICLGQNLVCITPNPSKVNPFFLYSFLNSPDAQGQMRSLVAGGAQPTISLKSIKEIKVFLPSLKAQNDISELLLNYDNLIENENRRIAILEEMAQSLYHEWFVKFRFPGHEHCQMVNSPLGPIPGGWEVKTLREVLELAYGKALKKADRKGGNVAVYGSGGIGGYHDSALVSGPCIIVGRKGNVGSIFWCERDCWPIDTVFYVKSEHSKFYLYFNLLHQTFHNSDAAVPGLNRDSAYSNKLILPDEVIIDQFDQLIRPIFAQLKILRAKNGNLKKQRDLLLPKLISGQIDLSQTKQGAA